MQYKGMLVLVHKAYV